MERIAPNENKIGVAADGYPPRRVNTEEKDRSLSGALSAEVPLAELVLELDRRISKARRDARRYSKAWFFAQAMDCDVERRALTKLRQWLIARQTQAAPADND